MRFLNLFILIAWSLVPAALVPAARGADAAPAQQAEFFEKHIRPVLVDKCYQCHSADADILHGGLRVDTREGLRSGGESGPAVTPGDVQDSLLLDALRHDSFEMPPSGKLPEPVIDNFVRWVREGAYDPRESDPAESFEGAVRRDDGILNRIDYEEGRKFWSFIPPAEQAAPEVSQTDWVRTPVDAFVLARLEQAGLAPSPAADRLTLLRRLKFDLLGLPPTPEEQQAFLTDKEPGAYERLVDRLLASPHYGERWARHWLDVVRYSDSNGLDENFYFGFAWRYRDYVVGALNDDKPYDQFVKEQIAGDLLAELPEYQADEEKLHDAMLATGFLAIGPKMQAERDNQKRVMDTVDELIDVTGQTFLGLSLACARCHDHKFDPISQRDYYALAGIFRSCAGPKGRRRDAPLMTAEQRPEYEEVRKRFSVKRKELDDRNAELRQLKKQLADKSPNPEKIQARIDQLMDGRADLQWEVRQLKRKVDSFPLIHTMHQGEPTDLPLHIRGSHLNLAKHLTPRGVLPLTSNCLPAPAISEDQPGRLQLAEWIVDPRHPLTARVLVNRVWRGHFGSGLVDTPSDFGFRGSPPSHPRLLDFLAREFVREGWSLKRLHRTILLSSTYRQASRHREAASAADPENRLLWRQNRRRLEVEPLRDNLLAVAGLLDTTRGGRVFDFPNGERVTNDKSANKAIDSYKSHRRAIYLPVIRVATYSMFGAFDLSDPSRPISDRGASVVAPQALFLMNGELTNQAATGFANRLRASEADGASAMVERAYRLAYCRSPTDAERQMSFEFLGQNAHLPREVLWRDYCQALMAASEFIYID